MGVKFAPRADPDKSFAPSQTGVVFGISYNSVDWTWSIPQEKLQRLILMLRQIIESDEISATQAKSLAGKLIHIKPLIPAGKYNINFIMALDGEANRAVRKTQSIKVSGECKRQVFFWLSMLKTCSGYVSIPNWPVKAQAWALDAYCDAAGGSLEGVGRGTGGVLRDWWFYIPWPKRVAAGGWMIDGLKVGRKMSALELVGPLVFMAAGQQVLAGKHVTIWVDNAGSVAIWNKGYSNSCRLSTAIVTAISAIAAATGCTVHIRKILRCSNTGAVLADQLSKARFKEFRDTASDANWPLRTEPAKIPVTLLAWIDKPVPDMDLADKILRELAKSQRILGIN